MDETRSTPFRTRTNTLLVAAAVAAVVAGCTTGGTATRTNSSSATQTNTSPTTPAAGPHSAGLLPVWRSSKVTGPDPLPWNLNRVGFIDTSGQLVVEPTYARYLLCPDQTGDVLVVAQDDDRVDVLDAGGTVVGSTQANLGGCGPLPGYAKLYRQSANGEPETWAATLPDLSRSDLPVRSIAVDDDWVLVTSYPPTAAAELVDRHGNHVRAAGSTGWDYFYSGETDLVSTGEWPVPATGADFRQGYLDRSGRWVAPARLSKALPFAHGHAVVSEDTSLHFVDTSLRQVGPDYDQVSPVYTSSSLFADVLGYMVTTPGGGSDDPAKAHTGLLGPDLTVLADPKTSRTKCHQSYATGEAACLVVDGAGPRLVRLPDGTSTPLPDGFTALLSGQLIATADGTRVFRTTTGEAFDVPAPFHAVTDRGWNPGGDTFVVCESDNGLRLVLDASGAVTPLATVEQTVTTNDGTVYFWAYAGDQQGWVDTTGAWLYHESRHQLTED